MSAAHRQDTNVRILRTMYRYLVHEHSPEEGRRFLDRLDLDETYLKNENHWVDYALYFRSWDVFHDIAHDPAAAFKVGRFTISKANMGSLWPAVRAAGHLADSKAAYAFVPKAANRMSRAGRFELEESERRRSRLRWVQHEGYPHRRELCDYRRGLLSAGPILGDMPPATVEEQGCIEKGDPACVYEVRYAADRPRWGRWIGIPVAAIGGLWLVLGGSGWVVALLFATTALAVGWTRDVLDQSAMSREIMADQLDDLVETKIRLEEDFRLLRDTKLELARKERLASLGELSAKLAHELRNPLGIIKGSAEILRRPAESADVQREMTSFIIDEVERMNTSITNFLVFARPKASHRIPTDAREIVERLLAEWATRAEAGAPIRFEAPSPLPRVLVDAAQLRQVLLNLILNASQAMNGKGSIAIVSRGDDATVEILVHDEGPGFSEEVRGEAFEPFFTTKEYGTGLGLTNVKQIIEANGGHVEIADPPGGRGGCVRVVLEAAAEDDETRDASGPR